MPRHAGRLSLDRSVSSRPPYDPPMRSLPTTRSLATWLSLLAALWIVLAPTLTPALAAARHDGWVVVCSAGGSKWVHAGSETAPQAPDPGPARHLFEHCPYCALHVDALALPPAAPGLSGTPLPGARTLPAAFLHAPRTLHAWTPSQPRAPPAC